MNEKNETCPICKKGFHEPGMSGMMFGAGPEKYHHSCLINNEYEKLKKRNETKVMTNEFYFKRLQEYKHWRELLK
ncbi:MAG: hypothetical protein OEL89_00185 [Candidatus Peregrinibacteria bacterium]|nr:hypothetical protein [Candidatus Peregrinibacteria bacterium]